VGLHCLHSVCKLQSPFIGPLVCADAKMKSQKVQKTEKKHENKIVLTNKQRLKVNKPWHPGLAVVGY